MLLDQVLAFKWENICAAFREKRLINKQRFNDFSQIFLKPPEPQINLYTSLENSDIEVLIMLKENMLLDNELLNDFFSYKNGKIEKTDT